MMTKRIFGWFLSLLFLSCGAFAETGDVSASALIESIESGGIAISICVPYGKYSSSVTASYSRGVEVFYQSKIQAESPIGNYVRYVFSVNRSMFGDGKSLIFTVRYIDSGGNYLKTQRIDASTLVEEFSDELLTFDDFGEKELCQELSKPILSIKTYKEMPIRM